MSIQRRSYHRAVLDHKRELYGVRYLPAVQRKLLSYRLLGGAAYAAEREGRSCVQVNITIIGSEGLAAFLEQHRHRIILLHGKCLLRRADVDLFRFRFRFRFRDQNQNQNQLNPDQGDSNSSSNSSNSERGGGGKRRRAPFPFPFLWLPRPEEREWLEKTFRAEILALDPQIEQELGVSPGDLVIVDAPHLHLLDYSKQLYLGRKVDLLAKLSEADDGDSKNDNS